MAVDLLVILTQAVPTIFKHLKSGPEEQAIEAAMTATEKEYEPIPARDVLKQWLSKPRRLEILSAFATGDQRLTSTAIIEEFIAVSGFTLPDAESTRTTAEAILATFATQLNQELLKTPTGLVYLDAKQEHQTSTTHALLDKILTRSEGPNSFFGPALRQLPSAPDLVGRDAELTELEQLLTIPAADPAVSGRHVGFQGMGGVGKTALALALAWRLRDRYPDAQLFVHLHGADPERRPPVKPADALQTVIRAFHPEAPLPDEIEPLQALYRSVLQDSGRRCLLLLDDAADADQVRPLLPPPNCLLLVTSRRQFALPGLLARHVDLLAPDKSTELLRRLAPRFDGQTAVVAAALCGHLPLALEVVAGLVNENPLLHVKELLDRIRLKKVTLAAVDAAFAVSYDLLDAAQRRRWCLLSVFPGSFDLAAAAAVWCSGRLDSTPGLIGATPAVENDEALDSMQALVKASLVEADTFNQRLRLHDLAQDFAARQSKQEDTYAARLRHAEHFTQVASRADDLYLAGGEKVVGGLALFDRERPNLEAAFEFLSACFIRRREEAEAARGVHAAWTPAGQDTLKRAEARPSEPNHMALRLLVELVGALVYTGSVRFHPRERIQWLESQIASAREIGDRRGEGNALGNLGNAYADLGDARKAIEFFEPVLAIVREIGDRQGEGHALGNLGLAYFALGDARKAIEFHEQALVIDREIGDRRGEGADLGNLGIAYADLGDARKAIEFFEPVLAIVREIGDRQGEGHALGNLGSAYYVLGDARKAIEFYEQALVIDREIGDRRGEGADLGGLGNAYAALGDARKAIESYEQHLAISREIGDRRGEGSAMWNSAVALETLGQRPEAIARAEAALRVYEEIESPAAGKVHARIASWRGSN